MEEEWKQIEGFSNYSISNLGNIKNQYDKYLKSNPNPKGYLSLALVNDDGERKGFGVHRLLGLAFLEKIEGKGYVDHIDRNKQNNKLENLRWISNAGNIRNQSKKNGYSSKYKGVSFDKSKKKWSTKIKINYNTVNLGRYETEDEAALAYNKFIIKNNIEGALLNDIV
jgi:hypothetical protein